MTSILIQYRGEEAHCGEATLAIKQILYNKNKIVFTYQPAHVEGWCRSFSFVSVRVKRRVVNLEQLAAVFPPAPPLFSP